MTLTVWVKHIMTKNMIFQNIRFHLPSNDRRNMERSTHGFEWERTVLARKNLLVLKWEFLVTEFTMMQYIDLYLFWHILPFEEFRTEWPFETVMSLLFAPRYNALVALQVYVTNGAFETLTWAIFLKNMDWQPVTKHTLNLHLTKYRSCVYGHGRSRPWASWLKSNIRVLVCNSMYNCVPPTVHVCLLAYVKSTNFRIFPR